MAISTMRPSGSRRGTRPTRSRTSLLVTLGLSLLADSHCSRSTTGPGLKLRLAAKAPDLGCLQTGSGDILAASSLRSGGTLRLTITRRTADGKRELICDASGKVPSDALNLDLGAGDAASFEYFGEYFNESGQREASGALLSTGTGSSSDAPPPTLHMFATGGWSCPPGKLAHARAFHSATALPSGELLLLGGIEPLKAYGPDVFGLIGEAEVYDPRSGTFIPVSIPTGSLTARALHNAAILDTDGARTRLFVYGGVVGPSGQPTLFVPDAPTQLRLMPGGNASPGGGEILTYNSADHTLSVSKLDTAMHAAAFAGGTALPGGGLLIAGGASLSAPTAFSRSNPATLGRLTEAASFFPSAGAPNSPPNYTFALGGASLPWLLAPSVTAIGSTTALVLGAKLPPDATAQPQAQFITGLPGSTQLPAATAAMGPSTVFHTATRIGPALPVTGAPASTQILVTGGFVQDSVPPYTTRQPPATSPVRLYTVSNPAQPSGAPSYQAVTPAYPSGTCGMADGHYRPAGYEAACATLSGNQVLVTGGTPSVPSSGCNECDATDPATNKLLCTIAQASLYDATTQAFSAIKPLPLARLGHQQVLLPDGNIMITGGLVRQSASGTDATAEAEVYNPSRTQPDGMDANDPTTAILQAKNLAHSGTTEAAPCPRL